MAELIVDAALPADLTQPEGKTRWDLTGIGIGAVRARSLVDAGGAITLVEAPASADAGPLRRLVYSDPTGGMAPSAGSIGEVRPGLLLGTRSILGLDEERDGRTDRLRIETEIVGIGWVHLPGGPREALLERALVLRQRADAAGYQAEALIHRWIDPRAGIVAAVWGPPTADGRGRESVGGGSLNLDVAASPQALSRLYENEVLRPILTRLGYGWDRGYVPISELTTQGYVTAGDLVNASNLGSSPPDPRRVPSPGRPRRTTRRPSMARDRLQDRAAPPRQGRALLGARGLRDGHGHRKRHPDHGQPRSRQPGPARRSSARGPRSPRRAWR